MSSIFWLAPEHTLPKDGVLNYFRQKIIRLHPKAFIPIQRQFGQGRHATTRNDLMKSMCCISHFCIYDQMYLMVVNVFKMLHRSLN